MSLNRNLSYSLAINELIKQLMFEDENLLILGQGVKSPWYVGNTCKDLIQLFPNRVLDTPISENAMTGAAVGASISGMKSIIIHPRLDFAMYAIDPIINQASNWSYMSGGASNCPVVFWLIVNRKGEQAAQHSQALHSIFSHIPGLIVIAPSSPHDVKGLLNSAIHNPNPVIFIDDRSLYNIEGNVPEEVYKIPIGKGVIRNKGTQLTIVSFSSSMIESTEAVAELVSMGYSVELIDLRTIKPLDINLIVESVKKTGNLIIVDASWKNNSITAEISDQVNLNAFGYLKSPVQRINLPDCPAPAARTLEKVFYINKDDIIKKAIEIIG